MSASWETYTWNGEPLKTALQGVATVARNNLQVVSDFLYVTADILDIIADLVYVLEDPLALLLSVMLGLLQDVLDLLLGSYYLLVVRPLSYNDLFGPRGFTERVTASFDDIYDYMRPKFTSTESVSAVSFFFSYTLLQDLYAAVAGLDVLFSSAVQDFLQFVDYFNQYTPVHQASQAQLAQRTYGRPPNWINGSIYGMVTFMEAMQQPLNQMIASMQPANSPATFLHDLAAAMRTMAQQFEDMVDQLDLVINLLNSSLFVAARLYIPLDVGGNSYVVSEFNNALAAMENSGTYSEDNYTFGVVLLSDAAGAPMIAMLKGT